MHFSFTNKHSMRLVIVSHFLPPPRSAEEYLRRGNSGKPPIRQSSGCWHRPSGLGGCVAGKGCEAGPALCSARSAVPALSCPFAHSGTFTWPTLKHGLTNDVRTRLLRPVGMSVCALPCRPKKRLETHSRLRHRRAKEGGVCDVYRSVAYNSVLRT